MILLQELDRRLPSFKSKQKTRYGLYLCPVCNQKSERAINNIKRQNQKSCGCDIDKHNMSKSKLYRVYKSMINRCYRKKTFSYERYGGRGIKVCNEWKSKASAFFEWAVKNGYQVGLTIDRINNDGNYEPSNCRWTTHKEQVLNQNQIPKNNTTGYRGVSIDKNKFRALITVDKKRIHLGFFETALDGAIAREKYIIENNLPNIRNNIEINNVII